MDTIDISGTIKQEIFEKKIELIYDVDSVDVIYTTVPQGVNIVFSVFSGGCWSQQKKMSELKNKLVGADYLKILVSNTNPEPKHYDFSIKINYKKIGGFEKIDVAKALNLPQLNKILYRLENDMNIFINYNDGIPCIYFFTSVTESDNILKEHTRRRLEKEECINIITEDNQIPSLEDSELAEWGREYNTFAAEIGYTYFRNIFGAKAYPKEGDWILMKPTNTLFSVTNAALERGIGGKPHSWKLTFSTYEDDATTENKENSIVNDINSYEKMFGAALETEIENTVNSLQNMTPQIYGDINRTYISNSIIYGDGSYNMLAGADGTEAVKYKECGSVKNISFWVSFEGDCHILEFGNVKISTSGNRLVIGGVASQFVLVDMEKYYININFCTTFSSVQILNESFVEVHFYDMMKPMNLIGTPALLFGNYEIGRILFGKENLGRNSFASVFKVKNIQKSGNFWVIDDCVQPNNNPRAKESNYRKNL